MEDPNLNNFVISKITATEWKIYKRIRLEALLDSPQAFATKYEDAVNRGSESWKKQCSDMEQGDSAFAFIGYLDNVPISLCGLYRNKTNFEEWEIVQVWTVKNFRGKGISEKMFVYAIDWAKNKNIKKLLAKVYSDNIRAKKFYEKMGFAVTKQVENEEWMYRNL